jgi:hypothetical protein
MRWLERLDRLERRQAARDGEDGPLRLVLAFAGGRWPDDRDRLREALAEHGPAVAEWPAQGGGWWLAKVGDVEALEAILGEYVGEVELQAAQGWEEAGEPERPRWTRQGKVVVPIFSEDDGCGPRGGPW